MPESDEDETKKPVLASQHVITFLFLFYLKGNTLFCNIKVNQFAYAQLPYVNARNAQRGKHCPVSPTFFSPFC